MPKRIYLSSPYAHGEEMQFVKEAFDTNWLVSAAVEADAFAVSLRWERLRQLGGEASRNGSV